MESLIDWNNYLYRKNGSSLIDELRKFKQTNLTNIPTKPTNNRYGMARIRYYGGFIPWTNIPIIEKDGGNI